LAPRVCAAPAMRTHQSCEKRGTESTVLAGALNSDENFLFFGVCVAALSFGTALAEESDKIPAKGITLNFNAGLRSLFDVAGHQPTIYRVGGSGI
jgi:hypothetical protein